MGLSATETMRQRRQVVALGNREDGRRGTTCLAGADVQRPGERAVPGDPLISAEAAVVGVVGGGGQGFRLQDVAGHLDAFQIPALRKAS